ncbi:AAA family ATPase [Aquipuribacter nitratireducens]|uniref:AAA family ATPase n=1 Tax=Aquipuribacter nitratireducens TaxID=650104 RepID=A0ABW0GK71_9MICO
MTPTKFAIRRVRLTHYRSIKSCDVGLGDLMVLVGPNGSGKSNFLDALRFTAQSLRDNLDNALRERGGVTEVRRRSTGHPTHFTIHLDFEWGSGAGHYSFSVGARRNGGYEVTRESCHVSTAAFGSDKSYFELKRRGADVEIASSEYRIPAVTADRLLLVALSGSEPFSTVFHGLAGVNVFNINPDAIRTPQKPGPGDLLLRDGANLASVLDQLSREEPRRKAVIEQYLSTVVDGIVSADRRTIDAWETVEFRQRVRGSAAPWDFTASSMSDGTLRVLGILTAVLGASSRLTSPVGVEEPETALHPRAAGLLLDAMREAADTRQVLVTTHSPELIDGLDNPDHLLAVRSLHGDTTIGRVDAAGTKALVERLFTAGELLRSDQLQPEGADEALRLFV